MTSGSLPAALHAHVGYGALGTGGSLGYEDKGVTVHGVKYDDALSTHAPARVLYYTGRVATRFRCQVALNDDVSPGISHADFAVCADGREVATQLGVEAGAPPRELVADVTDADLVELLVSTSRWDFCHAVWLQPEFDRLPDAWDPEPRLDALGFSEISPLPPLPTAERCVAVLASAGYSELLDDMLGSLTANGECQDARLVVMVLGECADCDRIIAKYRALPVACRPLRPPGVASKVALYSVALAVDAKRIVCLDVDTLVLGSLEPLFAALDALPHTSVLAAPEGNGPHFVDLGAALDHELVYRGSRADVASITGSPQDLCGYPLVVNSGVFAGWRQALLALDGSIRSMPGAVAWIDAAPRIWWREQFIFNLALARLDCGVELDPVYNLQLTSGEVERATANGREVQTWEGRPVHVLHFNGWGRQKHPDLRGVYSRCTPLAACGDGDQYAAFLRTLREWIGLRGVEALAWSFYSTRDGLSARVRDPSVLPLLALVHYLLRANGCARVLETGTARGVGAACMASAVAHRPDARVLTFDPLVYEGRAELWARLPSAMFACIEQRAEDSLVGMSTLRDAGERFDAAVLDSVHTESHLWSEFELASEIVVPRGMILVHDAFSFPEVAEALERVEAAGFGVTRLLAAESCVKEDAGFGLALIENRQRVTAT
jgi:predicted O-methyltransferase YrrM